MDKNNFPISFSIDKTFDSDQFLKLRFRLCHDGESPNKTFFTKETMVEANKSLEYIPILAHVYVDEETGKPVIGSHDMHIEQDKLNDGESRLVYDETPIGVIPSLADNDCVIEEYNGLNYTMVSGYIWRDYANYAEQLIEDAGDNKISMEIDFSDDSLSYDAANERYNISAYRYRGVTILNSSLGTGMKDAMATTTNFSVNEDVKSKMLVLMEELQKCLREYNANDSEQKGGNVNMENEDVVEPVVEEPITETMEEVVEEPVEETVTEETEEASVEEAAPTEETPATEEFVENEPEALVCTFRISHDDTRYGLQSLLNAMCDESHFYSVIAVYDKYFYYVNYYDGSAFKQNYKIRKDTVSFVDDPIPVFTEFVTQEERDELEKLRKDYAALVEFKETTETAHLQAKKDTVFAKPEFAVISETKAFKKLVENSENYTVEECEQRAKDILEDCNDYVANFAAKDNEAKKPKTLGLNFNAKPSKKKTAYGGLFDRDE